MHRRDPPPNTPPPPPVSWALGAGLQGRPPPSPRGAVLPRAGGGPPCTQPRGPAGGGWHLASGTPAPAPPNPLFAAAPVSFTTGDRALGPKSTVREASGLGCLDAAPGFRVSRQRGGKGAWRPPSLGSPAVTSGHADVTMDIVTPQPSRGSLPASAPTSTPGCSQLLRGWARTGGASTHSPCPSAGWAPPRRMGSREDLPARGQLGRSAGGGPWRGWKGPGSSKGSEPGEARTPDSRPPADHPDAAVLPEELPEPKDEKQPVGAGQGPLFYIGGSNGASM